MANKRRRLIGRVVSDKMQKTVVVAIEQRKMHQVYKKVVKTTKKVMAHDDSNAVGIGALVQVVESKPLSKNKRWVVEKVLEEAGARILQPVVGEVELPADTPAEPAEAEASTPQPVADEVELPADIPAEPVEAEASTPQPVADEVEVPAEPENGADAPEADEEAAS